MTPDSPVVSDFIPARHLTVAARAPRDIQFVVLHSMENGGYWGDAASVGRWWHGPGAPQTSAHYGVDPEGSVQYVQECDMAWAAGHHGNALGVHIELAGRAAWPVDEWPVSTIDNAARLLADVCTRNEIPCVLLDAAALLAGTRGVTTHAEVSKAWKESDHVDPGAVAEEVVRRAGLLL
jgi:N-acetyl-anhydromuramyl-L-alanine amidase AmpD